MKTRLFAAAAVALLLACVPVAACGGGLDESAFRPDAASLRGRRCSSDAQCRPPQRCDRGSCRVPGPNPGPDADPPPAQCDRRQAGATAIEAVVRIDRYQGLIHGRNGTHEIAFGTITRTPWVFDAGVVDTARVQLALNVASSVDPVGLPTELPLAPGDTLRVEGEYISAAHAHVRGAQKPTAVIHYTHAPCGFVVINDRKYR